MRFLVDECTGPRVADWLRSQGHEVFSVFDEVPGMRDAEVLSKARVEEWVLITNDKDFGELVFREHREHHGIIFFRLADDRSENKIHVLSQLLERYSSRLAGQFVTVTETKVRFSGGR